MGSVLKSGRKYHVFLSFRGEDIRNNFLGHLYTALDQKGICTYVDSKELKKGEQIDLALMKAIEGSQIAIIIFSKDYASSWWCLEELVKIIDCKKERDLIVFPLFYKVEPRELRTPRGSYRDAMVKHGSKYGKDSKEVRRWEKALSDASYLSGWSLKEGDESELIQQIVMEISIHLNQTLLHVATHPIGIDSRMAELKSMINLESNDNVLMVGLWGQGGIGKTTLAKAIYNDIFNQFENSCFLANVREVSKDCKDLVALQEKLLFETLALKEKLAVSNVDRGINLIQERLCQKKVLLILDDVNDLCQLQALVGEGKWFHNGSRIIITTRDSHLLTYLGIDQDHVYKVRELDDNDARELFSKHAFPTHQNFKIRTNLVNSVLNHAKGLPLALEVLGSFLCGRREYEWESALDDISMAPKKGINDVLKISYDGLEPKVKEIFLHIACFFKGWNSEYVKKVLNTCDLSVVIGLEILKERCLIRIELGKIHMHDLIQLMGMHIVNQESDDPWRRSRLWLYNDVVNVVSSEMENCAVKAIVLDPPEPIEIFVGPDALTKMRTLRLLILLNVHNTFQDPICVPNELRWFRWDGCAPPIPEYSYGEKKLAGLDMSHSSITVVPNQFKGFQNLKYINFSFCKLLVCMPDLSCASNLKELDFSYCKNLVETHESIADLDKLEVLNLASCSELSVFPNVLKSKNLRRLNFNHCMKFERFPDIPHKLEGLKELDFHSTAIKELPPTSIENLVALKIMSLHHCKNLVNLPSTIYKLQNLEELTIWSSPNLIGFPKYEDSADPCMKAGLPNLRHLSIAKCNLSEVQFLENLSCFPLLNELDLEQNNITALPSSINRRDSLSKLLLSNCHQLQEIPELPPFLTHFFADNCESLQKYEDLIPIHHIVRASLGIDTDEDVPKFILPQEEMPQWVFPIERDSVFFMVSKDLYDKIIGVAFCAILKNDEKVGDDIYCYDSYVNGKRINSEEGRYDLSDLDHIAIEYLDELWGEVDFAQIDGHYIQFGVGVRGRVVKKWGVRIICKQLGDDLKAKLRDNQLIDLALLYEVGNGSTDSAAMSSHVHKENSSEANLQEDLQECQMGTEEHSEIASKRKREFNLPLSKRIKTMWNSIFDRWRGAW